MVEQPHSSRSRQAQQSRMPVDKQSNGKPITPALSSNFRSTRSPLTPRLAGSAPNSPASGVRREPLPRTRSPARDGTAAVLLNGNITPRTVARKTRIDTDSPSTPNTAKETTSTRPRAVSGARPRASPPNQAGLGISSPQVVAPGILPRPKTSPQVYTIHRRTSGAKSTVQDEKEDDSKFFRADDTRPHTESSAGASRQVPSTEKGPVFFVGSPNADQTLSPKLSPSREPKDEKFFRVDDAKAPSYTVNRPGLKANPSFASVASTQSQPVTKSKPFVGRTQSPSRTPVVSPANTSPRKEGIAQPRASNSSRQPIDRRGSVGSSLANGRMDSQLGHRKSMSTSSLSATPTRKMSSPKLPTVSTFEHRLATTQPQQTFSVDSFATQTASPDTMSPKSASFGSAVMDSSLRGDGGTEFNRAGSITSLVKSPDNSSTSLPQQPTSQNQSEDAANARRERKVLDLEISNSSLLAINKTLEKELRKQNSELRRYRRLSRSGRLSLAPTNRSISGSTLETVAEGEDEFPEISDDEEDSDADTFDDEDVLSNDSSSVQSPTSKARQRARDERRLMLDLSKHQQMLIDSQKLTQSIRRCLTCTEELIRDGNKALQYKVGVGDIKLGGRVLSHDDAEEGHSDNSGDEPPRRQGLLSPSLMTADLAEASLWANGSGQPLNGVLDPDLASPTALQDCLDLLTVTKT